MLLALGDLWEGLHRATINPTTRGLHLTNEYLGGYTRICAGPAAHPRLVVEWNESTRHLRVIRCEDWPGFESILSATVAHVRAEARIRGIQDVVDASLMRACQEPSSPIRRTVAQRPMPALAARRA
ncbi:MAG: hypothetical protein HY875_00305 [Chloroflexi bacterium]|nr:hypothetical protein [Chloroflexota bacterium]